MSARSNNFDERVLKAEHDLLAVDRLQAGEPTPWDLVCFHAQQAAEKYLKAFLVFHFKNPPKTHDLAMLSHLCREFDDSLGELEDDCKKLTEFGRLSRYPGTAEATFAEESRALIDIARRIKDAVLGKTRPG